MSWYSDGEMDLFDRDPDYCENCPYGDEGGASKAECDACEARHYETECRYNGQRCETCVSYEWDAVDEVFRCRNSNSEWLNEEVYDDGWCDKWVEG